jgi:colanic acid/amylovoran biosynthesis protein
LRAPQSADRLAICEAYCDATVTFCRKVAENPGKPAPWHAEKDWHGPCCLGGMTNENTSPIAIFGAAPDTRNLGVTALSQSIATGLWSRGFRDLVMFDHGRGSRQQERIIGNDRIAFRTQGAVGGHRVYRGENLARAIFQSRLGLRFHPILKTIDKAGAVLDISGGDSFSDIYGERRYLAVSRPKKLVLDAGTPLVLMPQTYGPFVGRAAREEAADILRRCALAYARDRRSLAAMRDLLGQHFDPLRHGCGVDVAFALPTSRPSLDRLEPFMRWKKQGRGRIIGINVSGLLFNEPGEARRKFALKVDFRALALSFARKVLEETDARILLLPHVLDRPGSQESDEDAVRAVFAELVPFHSPRLFIPEVTDSASEAKWFIAQCDWFTGARMHATIGALSSGVPALALAYSGKMQGVFETCGMGHCVLDLRVSTSEREAVEAMFAAMARADEDRLNLAAGLPSTFAQARFQMDRIAAFLADGNLTAKPCMPGERDAA